MSKFKAILSLTLNSVAVISSLIGLILVRDAGAIVYAKYFTIITNCMILLLALVCVGFAIEVLIRKEKQIVLSPFLFVLKLITATAALLTFLTVVCYLQYQPGLIDAPATGTVFWNNIFHHYVSPISFILGFIFLDIDRKYCVKLPFFGPLLLVLYMAYSVPICIIDASIIGGAPYPFMDTNNFPPVAIPFIALLFLVVGLGLSFVLWTLNRIAFLIFTGEEISTEEIQSLTPEEAATVKVNEKEIEEEIKAEESTPYKGPKIYHISKRDDKMWHVKFANGKKAIKLFPTQAEAIVFAKRLAKSQGGSIRVHSLKGRIRKSN